MKSSEEQTFLSAQIPRRLYDDLRRLARTHDRSVSAETREALRLHLRVNDVGATAAAAPAPRTERGASVATAVDAPALGGPRR